MISARLSNRPKVFFECGVGRVNSKGKWQMVSGMLRVSKNYSKPKIVKKKVKRLSNQEIELYVHIIRLNEGKLEVCTSIEELEREMEKRESKNIISVSSLKENQEVVGTVVDVRPYGVMVDVGANRKGLLHIQKVADLYKKYIDKESGLIEAGLVSIHLHFYFHPKTKYTKFDMCLTQMYFSCHFSSDFLFHKGTRGQVTTCSEQY